MVGPIGPRDRSRWISWIAGWIAGRPSQDPADPADPPSFEFRSCNCKDQNTDHIALTVYLYNCRSRLPRALKKSARLDQLDPATANGVIHPDPPLTLAVGGKGGSLDREVVASDERGRSRCR